MLSRKNFLGHQNIYRLIGEECLLEKRWRKLEKEKKRKRKKNDYIQIQIFIFKFNCIYIYIKI